MTRFLVLAVLAASALPTPATAAVKTKPIDYDAGGTKLQGFLAWNDAKKGKQPGVLVVHEWWGHNEHARNQAKRLAEAGYVAFALDMYGKGKVATHPKDAQAFAAEATKDPETVRTRFDTALGILKSQPQVDPERIGVVGYCMGGGIALAMARAGEDLGAVAVFHAPLAPRGEPAQPGKVKAKILAQEGGKDPMIPSEQVKAFEEEMKNAGVDARVIVYPEAKHSFTNPDAGKAGMDALAYDPKADKESFKATLDFFGKALGK
jgi:dienelactone hydrolase